MPDQRSFVAVDLGASSGRVLTGRIGPDQLTLTETHRFRNGPVRLPDGLHWDVLGIYREILHGLRLVAGDPDTTGHPVSIGIDSWAVDYGLLDDRGALLGVPYHYRDSRTAEAAPRVVRRVGAAELYAANGLQYLPFNTIFQLAAANRTAELAAARTLLLIPDLIAYWLTGEIGAEITNASTTGLLDAATHQWSPSLAAAAGVDPAILPELRAPGSRIGALLPETAAETSLTDTVVTTVASHDTASAVIGVPAATPDFGYISAGTWSLAGLELPGPVRGEAARAANFTNELGLDGTTRFLRNIMGLWLLQETLRTWELDSAALPGLIDEAASAAPFVSLVNPDDERFLPPGDMPARIAEFCRETGQPAPASRGALVRCVLESLALAHRATLRQAAELAGREVPVVHMVGGGARNELLCQFTADALGVPVVAGPVEATALGNILVQARAAGLVDDLPTMRRLLATTQRPRQHQPAGDTGAWAAAARRVGLD